MSKIELNTKHIETYLKVGANDKNWYDECRKTLIGLFGEERLWLVCQLLAATSMHTSLKANLVLFRKALYQYDNNELFVGFMPGIIKQLNQIREGKGLTGRKINNFALAMFGDPNAVVVDTWILRAFGVETKRMYKERVIENSADPKRYNAIEKWIRRSAIRRKPKLEPRELCSMIWAGVRKYRGYMYEPTRYCDLIRQQFSLPLFEQFEEEIKQVI